MADSILTALYDELAADYERTRVPRFRPVVKRLLQLYDTRPGSHVLDAGCGTGLVATMVAPRAGHGGHILGVDASDKMLEIARAKAQGYGFDQCEFVVGDITALDRPDASFDLVVCSFALWGEPKALFAEFHRVLKPNGALLLQNWGASRDGTAGEFDRALVPLMVPEPNAQLAEIRDTFKRHGELWADMRDPDDYVRVLQEAGFETASGQSASAPFHFAGTDELYEFYAVGVRARAEIAAMDEGARARLQQTVTATFAPLLTPKGIDEPRQAIQAIARKAAA